MGNMDVAMSNRVIARDSFGRFIREVEDAGNRAVQELIREGGELSQSMAPVGSKVDRRTMPLKDSIFTHMETRTRGYWGSVARHALPIEKGARPHIIMGSPRLRFFWEAQGRMWIPAATLYGIPGMRDLINHPGNPAQPFLRPAYDIIATRAAAKLREHYGKVV